MSISFIIFIVFQVLALAYFLEVMRRLRQKRKEYPLEETAETLPFGFVRLRHIVMIYIILYLLWVLFSFWLYFVWLGTATSSLPAPTETLNL